MLLTKPHKTVVLKRFLFILVCFGLGWYMKGKLTPKAGMMMGGGTPYVLVEELKLEDASTEKSHIAHIEAINSVSLQPKVSGTLSGVHFKEGSFVHQGDVLFTIEHNSQFATLNLRKAELEKAKAGLTEAERNYERQIKLSKQNIASKATFDAAESAFLQAKAGVAQAEANLDLAQITYDDTFLNAPIDGYIGKTFVTKGNRVTASQQVLAKIVQLNPIRIAFTLTDKEFISFKQNTNNDHADKIKARITLADGTVKIKNFLAGFNDNEVSTSTATVTVYGDVENEDETLIPGNYVGLALITDNAPAILVPQAALFQDENGFYTFVVNKDSIAEERRLVLGDVIGNRQIVQSGLNDGDKVVIKGGQKLKHGTKVEAATVSADLEM